jgi:hypothetical protein
VQEGSIVKIITTGGMYSGYTPFFEHYGLNEYIGEYATASNNIGACKPGDLARVLHVRNHLRDGRELYVLRNLRNDAIVLFNGSTIELVSPPCDECFDISSSDMSLSSLFD